MKMEQTECSETSAHKIQTPGNSPEESIQRNGCIAMDRCTGLGAWKSGGHGMRQVSSGPTIL